jgi:hypothetical protein
MTIRLKNKEVVFSRMTVPRPQDSLALAIFTIRKSNGFLVRNVYLTKVERIEIDFQLQEISWSLVHSCFSKTVFTVLAM